MANSTSSGGEPIPSLADQSLTARIDPQEMFDAMSPAEQRDHILDHFTAESWSHPDLLNVLAVFYTDAVQWMRIKARGKAIGVNVWDLERAVKNILTRHAAQKKAEQNGTVPRKKQKYTESVNQDEPTAPPLPWSDYTNARALILEHGETLFYCHPWRKWLVWTGAHWSLDETGIVRQKAKQTIKRLSHTLESLDDDQAHKLLAHIKKSLSTASLKAMIECAQDEPGIPLLPEALDTNHWLLNCANGTLDLTTGTLTPHAPGDRITRCLSAPYDPEALCPTWEAFLARIMDGNTNLITFLQQAIGYALTGIIREHVLFILWGTGRNGKSTFLNTIRGMLGAYAIKAPSELLMVSNNDRHPTERADLLGKRFVSAIETEQGRRLAEVFVKEATGGDPIRARRMREDFWEFLPTHKVFLATNHKPVVTGTDTAIWERLRLIPFAVTIPEEERDTALAEKLEAELPGILAWAVRGCLDWHQHGLGAPEEVLQATAGYRTEMDMGGQFIAECCLLGASYRTKASDLYDTYKRWCEQNGEHTDTQRTWGMSLSERGLERFKIHGMNWWRGITAKPNGWDTAPPRAEGDRGATEHEDKITL